MDDFGELVGRGFFRFIGYVLAEIFFGTICYWLAWPICKIITFGNYPSSKQIVYLDDYSGSRDGFWCSAVGLLAIIAICVFAIGHFNPA
ncbi:MAG: hypothetical protein K6L81_16170 [Agarilytica sp.]